MGGIGTLIAIILAEKHTCYRTTLCDLNVKKKI